MKKAVILSGVAWNTTIQRHHVIARYLTMIGYEVIFVESITSSKFEIKKVLQRIKSKVNRNKIRIENPVDKIRVLNYKFINPLGGLFFLINRMKAKNLLDEIGKVEIDILINYVPVNTTEYIVKNSNHKKLIYDCVRDFQNWGGYPSNLIEIEENLISMSDLILTDSFYLTDKMKNRVQGKEVFQLLPTVSKELVGVLGKCRAKEKIKSIVYFGQLGSHIDVECLEILSNKGYDIHIVGDISVSLNFKYEYHGYFSDPVLLGETIAKYADAIIIPYKGNMNGVIPAKIMQSLATGLPIFINDFYDSRSLEKYLYVYSNVNELLRKLNEYSGKKHKRKEKISKKLVEENTEEKQFKEFSRCIIYGEK